MNKLDSCGEGKYIIASSEYNKALTGQMEAKQRQVHYKASIGRAILSSFVPERAIASRNGLFRNRVG